MINNPDTNRTIRSVLYRKYIKRINPLWNGLWKNLYIILSPYVVFYTYDIIFKFYDTKTYNTF